MTNRIIVLGSVILFLVGFTSLNGCTTPQHNGPKELHVQTEDRHENKMGDHHEEGPLIQEKDLHMKHMNDVSAWLKSELKNTYNKPVPTAEGWQLLNGKKIYANSCASCHGTTGKGDGPTAASLKHEPADFTDPEHSTFYSEQGRVYIIKKGIQGTAMGGWDDVLNEEEILSVYAYIRSLAKTTTHKIHHH
jgi:cytochrome c5